MKFDNLVSIRKMKRVRGLPRLRNPDKVICKKSEMGKMKKSSFKRKNYCSNDILELVHTHLWGPIGVQSYYGNKYFTMFVDDFSRMMSVIFIKEKYESFQMFKWYLDRVKKETRKDLKFLRSNRGGKFISDEFNIFCNEKGIKRQVSAPRTTPHNGIAKRRNRSIMECPRILMIEKNISQKY